MSGLRREIDDKDLLLLMIGEYRWKQGILKRHITHEDMLVMDSE